MMLKKLAALLLSIAMIMQICTIGTFASNGDSYTRSLDIITDMVHNNPGDVEWNSNFNDPTFLSMRGYTGQVFFLYDAAQFGIDWSSYDEEIFPVGSESYNWVMDKRAELNEKYNAAIAEGLKVYFMMDFIVLPNSVKTLYGDEVMTNGKIDINKPKTRELINVMIDEMFTTFPQIDGIYFRYGESYVGENYGVPYHFGNNPIGVSGNDNDDHAFLLELFREEICEKRGKEVIYRTWSTSIAPGSFTTDPNAYLDITNRVEPHENLYIAIKHTSGDFWRNYIFNQTLNIGNHQQIVEVQAAREYEGKGAHPNYVAGGIINGFPEYEWQMSDDKAKCLRDVVNVDGSKIVGIWTWSRGGGWGGPYINGETTQESGSELWPDLNAYVLAEWAKDTSRTDEELVKQYAKEVLGMSDADAETLYKICTLSADAVLYGKGTNSAPMLEVNWMRDASINSSLFNNCVNTMFTHKEADGSYTKLNERRYSVELWNEIVELAATLDDSLPCKEFIEVTCEYGLDLYSITERLFTAAILTKEISLTGNENLPVLETVVADYDALWADWEALFNEYDCCPTLYTRSGFDSIMANYRYSITSTPSIKLSVGDTASVGLSVSPYSISDVKFSSSDTSVATISETGTVTAVGNGIARIEMITNDGLLSTATMVYVGVDGNAVKDIIFEENFEDHTVGEALNWPMNVQTDKQSLTVEVKDSNALTVNSSGVGGSVSCYHTQTFPATTGIVVTEFDMAVKNKNSGYFFICDSDGKIITQVDFRSDGIYVDIGGSVQKISSLPYNANEWYHIKLEINTDEKTFIISVNDTDPKSFSFREAAVNVGMFKVGLNRAYSNSVYYDNIKIYTTSVEAVDITAEDIVSTITSVNIDGTDTVLKLPAVPEGFEIELISSSDTSLISLDGKLNLDNSSHIAYLDFKVTKLADNSTATAESVYTEIPAAMINLAPLGTAIDDGTHSYYDSSKITPNINDGDTKSSSWQYAGIGEGNKTLNNCWVGVKLAQISTVREIVIYWEDGSRCSASTSGYTVQYSDDGENWKDIPNAYYKYSTTGNGIDTVTLSSSLETQYIRVNCLKIDNGKGYSPKIYELQIFGATGTSSAVPGTFDDSQMTVSIGEGITASQFTDCTVVDKNGNALTASDAVGTGSVVTKDGKDYTVILLGDTSGDGMVNSTDFMQVRRQFLGLFEMTDIQKKAADVSGEGDINSTDFTRIRRHFLGTYNLFS